MPLNQSAYSDSARADIPIPMEIIVETNRIEANYWRDLWRYRDLFRVLAWRDVSVRYKQTVIGIVWALLRPLLTLVAFTLVFGRLAKLPSDGDAPYALLVLAGLLPWTFVSSALVEASNSLVGNAGLITKVYFPRLVVPSATVVVAFVDFMITLGLFFVLMTWFQFWPSWRVVALPAFILVAIFAALGPGLWLSALNVKYRDFRYVIPFLVQVGVYISPVGFSSRLVPDEWRLLYSLNPMVGVIDGFRWCLLGAEAEMYWPGFGLTMITVLTFLYLGVRQFRAMERTMADVI